jgi:Leucine-rich repeat (LRR) protein
MSETEVKPDYNWWNQLEDQWKRAFNMAYLQNGDSLSTPKDEDLIFLQTAPVLRLVGPEGPNPNLNFELTNCSGIAGLKHLRYLFLTFHNIVSLEEIKTLTHLNSLYFNDNKVTSISPLSSLNQLEDLCFPNNLVESLEPISNLPALKKINCANNKINSLNSFSENHRGQLTDFFGLPNEIPYPEVRDFENQVGIKCKNG